MAKLPANLVKTPVFDNPLRPTNTGPIAVPELPRVVTKEDGESVATVIPSTEVSDGADELAYRISARFTEEQWRALQMACHDRRMKGQRINVAELLREIVDEWRS